MLRRASRRRRGREGKPRAAALNVLGTGGRGRTGREGSSLPQSGGLCSLHWTHREPHRSRSGSHRSSRPAESALSGIWEPRSAFPGCPRARQTLPSGLGYGPVAAAQLESSLPASLPPEPATFQARCLQVPPGSSRLPKEPRSGNGMRGCSPEFGNTSRLRARGRRFAQFHQLDKPRSSPLPPLILPCSQGISSPVRHGGECSPGREQSHLCPRRL